MKKRTTALIILDGWGYSQDLESNAILAARTPTWDKLWNTYPHTLISGSGTDVGLPDQQMGNSEVGHLNLGSGRVVYQDFSRISKAIEDGEFQQNPVIISAIDRAVTDDKAIHVMGLLSDGGVHSHINHIKAVMQLAEKQGATKIYLHAFLDGRDTPPRSAEKYINEIDLLGSGRIASLVGRYYAMDRDQRWDRVELAYRMLTDQAFSDSDDCFYSENAIDGLNTAYARNENDEFVKPTLIGKKIQIEKGDVVIFMNYRADRAREITRAFVDDKFSGFERKSKLELADFVSLTQYADSIKQPVHTNRFI